MITGTDVLPVTSEILFWLEFWKIDFIYLTEYVLEMEGNMVANTRIIINRQWNLEEEQTGSRREALAEHDSQIMNDSTASIFAEEEDEGNL